MFHVNTQRMIDYWTARAQPGRAPRRAAIDPGDFRQLMSQTFILGREARGAYPFRLTGGFVDDLAKITADLRTRPVSDDELARAKVPRVDGLRRAQVTNQFWLAELSGAQVDPRRLQLVRDMVPGTQKVTAADVREAAIRFLRDDKAFRLMVKPPGTMDQADRLAPGALDPRS